MISASIDLMASGGHKTMTHENNPSECKKNELEEIKKRLHNVESAVLVLIGALSETTPEGTAVDTVLTSLYDDLRNHSGRNNSAPGPLFLNIEETNA